MLEEPNEALAQLTMAQTQGVELAVNKIDNPLVDVQLALRLAERMVGEGNHEAADDNLRVAQIHLGTYGALVGKDGAKVVKELEDDIAELMARTDEVGAASSIRGFWERAVSWFREGPGQAHVVGNKPPATAESTTVGQN